MLELVVDAVLRGTRDLGTIAKSLGVTAGVVRSLLHGLEGLEVRGDEVVVTDNVSLAVSALARGVPLRTVSRHLTWREFEEEVRRVLEAYGFVTFRNVSLTRGGRRLEVDVIGFSRSYALIVDCKHWKASAVSRLTPAAVRHRERAVALLRSVRFAELAVRGGFVRGYAIPVLVTLASSYRGVLEGVTVVPVQHLRGFLNELDTVVYELPRHAYRAPRGGLAAQPR